MSEIHYGERVPIEEIQGLIDTEKDKERQQRAVKEEIGALGVNEVVRYTFKDNTEAFQQIAFLNAMRLVTTLSFPHREFKGYIGDNQVYIHRVK